MPQPDGRVTQWLEFWGRATTFDAQTILRELTPALTPVLGARR